MSLTDHFKRIIHRYPYPLSVDHSKSPRPHEVDVPYHFGYTPIKNVGRFYLFLTPQDRDDFAKRHNLRLRIPKTWPPERYR